jgi:hypothetical protein
MRGIRESNDILEIELVDSACAGSHGIALDGRRQRGSDVTEALTRAHSSSSRCLRMTFKFNRRQTSIETISAKDLDMYKKDDNCAT